MSLPLDNTYLTVFYNGNEIVPTPLVNYNRQPIEFGYIYGYNTEITLEGLVTGIDDTQNARNEILNIFDSQFENLSIGTITFPNIIVNNISFEQSPYFKNSFIKYTVKCTSYEIPEGVLEPSNEFSFSEGADGVITVIQKISAKAIQNNTEAFSKAKNFVNQFTNQKPSIVGSLYLGDSDGVLVNFSENANKSEGLYSITKTFKYNTTDSSDLYIRYTSIEIQEDLGAEYKTANYSYKIVGSPIDGVIEDLYSTLNSINYLYEINQEYGYDVSNWVKINYSANLDKGANTIDVKITYYIAANPGGFFDYVVSYEKDNLVGTEVWKVDGDFKCYGPLSYRQNELEFFKGLNKNENWKNYLIGLIQSSPLYLRFHDLTKQNFSKNLNVIENEVKDMASLKLSMTLNFWYEPEGVADLKYSINCSPPRWIYEFLPSANVEGAYIIQDLQTKTNASIQMNISCSSYDKPNAISILSGYLDTFKLQYIEDAPQSFLVEDTNNTGTYDISISKKYLCSLKEGDNVLTNLISAGSQNSAPTRSPNYNFGY